MPVVAVVDGGDLDVRSALCFPNFDRPRRLGLTMRSGTIVMDAPRGVAKLAGRKGPMTQDFIERLGMHLARRFPPA